MKVNIRHSETALFWDLNRSPVSAALYFTQSDEYTGLKSYLPLNKRKRDNRTASSDMKCLFPFRYFRSTIYIIIYSNSNLCMIFLIQLWTVITFARFCFPKFLFLNLFRRPSWRISASIWVRSPLGRMIYSVWIFLILRSGTKAKARHWVPPFYIQCFEYLAEGGEQSVLALGIEEEKTNIHTYNNFC